jgi:hypothetical protein
MQSRQTTLLLTFKKYWIFSICAPSFLTLLTITALALQPTEYRAQLLLNVNQLDDFPDIRRSDALFERVYSDLKENGFDLNQYTPNNLMQKIQIVSRGRRYVGVIVDDKNSKFADFLASSTAVNSIVLAQPYKGIFDRVQSLSLESGDICFKANKNRNSAGTKAGILTSDSVADMVILKRMLNKLFAYDMQLANVLKRTNSLLFDDVIIPLKREEDLVNNDLLITLNKSYCDAVVSEISSILKHIDSKRSSDSPRILNKSVKPLRSPTYLAKVGLIIFITSFVFILFCLGLNSLITKTEEKNASK